MQNLSHVIRKFRFVGLAALALVWQLVLPGATSAIVSGYAITVSSQQVAPFSITLNGTASANPYKGTCPSGQNVSVLSWNVAGGMLPTPEAATLSSTTCNSSTKVFTTNWTATHVYPATGTYTIRVMVYHGQPSGQDGSDLAQVDVNAIIPPATITVIKHVVNTGGGTKTAADFTMNVSGSTGVTPSPASIAGAENPGTTVGVSFGQNVTSGTYSVDEAATSGYTKTLSSGCTGTIASGQAKTCTITNSFNPNNPPVLGSIGNKTVDELTNLSFTATATDADADTLSYSLAGTVPTGASINSSSGVFSWTPTEVQGPGNYTFDVVVSDGKGGTDSETITVTVNEVNLAPTATPQSVTTAEDTALPITFSSFDADIPANTLTYSIDTPPTHGTLGTLTGNQVTYTPAANYHGADSFVFKVTDNGTPVLSGTATVSITVTSVNDAPVLGAIGNKTIDELTNLSFTAAATDADSDTLTYSLSGAPSGTSINSSTGVFSWTPTEAQGPGSYPFDVVVSDGHGGTDSETITVTVNEVNLAPVATGTATSTHQGTAVNVGLSATDSDIPVQTLSYSIVTQPSNGTLSGPVGNQVTYTPNAGFTGSDSFTFKANDSVVDSNTATVSIAVTDDAPVLNSIGNKSVDELTLLSFTATASDPNSDPLSFSLAGTVPAGAAIDSAGNFTWTPTEVQGPGSYPVTVQVSDGALMASETITITVNEVNLAPVGDAQSVTTNEDVPVTISLSATDADIPANALTYAIATPPTHGTLGTLTGNQVTYTPEADYNGADSFTFTATDDGSPQLTSAAATVSLTITPVNDPPTITLIGSDPMSITVGGTFTNPGATGADTEDGPLTPVVTGTVDTSTLGSYTLTYTVTDSGSLTASVTRTVDVTALPTFTLTLTKSGEGSGGVANDQANTEGDWCDVGCNGITGTYAAGTVVTLTADPAAGSTFNGSWSGACTGTGTCVITMNSSQTVNAHFAIATPPPPSGGGGGGSGGGGSGGGGFICSTPNPSSIGVTLSSLVGDVATLSLTYPATVTSIAYSVHADFAGSNFEAATPTRTLFVPSGTTTIYVRFHEATGCSADKSIAVPQVLGASTGPTTPPGRVLGESTGPVCKAYLNTYIKFGSRNNAADVKRLQQFLNDQGYGPLKVTGIYNAATFAAVKKYQLDNNTEILSPWVLYGLRNDKTPTGYVYKTTKRWINLTKCPALNLPKPKLP